MICRASATYRCDLFDGLIIDNFAGGGGAGLGIERALGRPVDHAINHDSEAIAMHRINHPGTEHHHSDVWEVDPRDVTQGRPIDLAWFSPDCKHFSKAKGGRPVSPRVRGLAWVVIRWAELVRPRVIMLENVEEFRTWGPLVDDLPCKKRKGEYFSAWVNKLRMRGYDVEWKELKACDYGTPTIRKRLFLVARCDGEPIVWPEVTHGQASTPGNAYERRKSPKRRSTQYSDDYRNQCRGAVAAGDRAVHRGTDRLETSRPVGHKNSRVRGRLTPHRTAAECIDWSIPCPSIFERKRPLADNTLRRIAAGIKRYVLDSANPFIVSIANYGGNRAPAHSIDDSLSTITANPKGGHHAVCVPTLVATNHGDSGGRRSYPMDEPMRTVVASSRGGEALVVPTLVQTGYGERRGQSPRVPGLEKPLGTVVAGGAKHALVSAFLSTYYGPKNGYPSKCTPLTSQTRTQTTENRHSLVAAHLTHMYTSNTRGGAGDLTEPIKTVTAGGNHAGLVAALLVKYYGSGGQWSACDEPMHTVSTKGRMGLVTVELNGEPYVITDIGMRMLQPRELYRAQGFGDDYVIDRGIGRDGDVVNLTKTAQVRMCGNSVCPPAAEALVRANMSVAALPTVGGAA